MNIILDIRGTHGSGKSTLVRNILSRYENELILSEDVPYHYVEKLNLCIMGRYDMRGSGVDNVKGSDRLQSAVRKLVKEHNVVYEGIIVSETFSRWNEFAEEGSFKYVFLYLNVDIESCIKRVEDRRKSLGNFDEFNPKNLLSKSSQISRTIQKLKDSNKNVIELVNPSRKEAYTTAMSIIKEKSQTSAIIQIRGTSGSGKTWIINQLRSMYEFKPIKKNNEIVGYYCKELNTFLVGKYETACGGCDSIKTQDETCRRIKKATSKGWNVIFEGLICSHISKRYAELYKELTSTGRIVRFIFLNTPLETCRENINKRRALAGKEPTTAKNTEKDYTSTRKSRKNMNSMGVPKESMPILSSKKALDYILELLDAKED